VLIKIFVIGMVMMTGTLTVIGVTDSAGVSVPGLTLALEFLVFMSLFPTLMGVFVSAAPEDAGKRIVEREFRHSYRVRR
jgi:hypothetical protein